ncbi:hypothetical protein [Bacteroides sp.]
MIKSFQFYGQSVSLLSGESKRVLAIPTSIEVIKNLSNTLKDINHLKQLQAWLREAIKAKEKLTQYYRGYELSAWAKENGIDLPARPQEHEPLDEDAYISNLDVKERARYYNLETACSTLGKVIHPTGTFAIARKNMMERKHHPYEMFGSGRDSIIYENTIPAGMEEAVEKKFFELQAQHREYQKQLNAMKFAMEEAISESEAECRLKDKEARDEYLEKLETAQKQFKDWRENKLVEVKNLKIIVPDSLLEIMHAVQNSIKK